LYEKILDFTVISVVLYVQNKIKSYKYIYKNPDKAKPVEMLGRKTTGLHLK